jgi:hypothetical protein
MKLKPFFIRLFALPSVESKALKELEDAQRGFLDACTGREYAEAMVKYHEARIRRLTSYLHVATVQL